MDLGNSLLESFAKGDHCGFRYRDQQVSPAHLKEAIETASDLLGRIPLSEGRTGILLDNTPLFVAAFTSIISLNQSAVLISAAMKPYEIERAIRETDIRLLISSQEFDEVLGELRLAITCKETLEFPPWGLLRFLEILPQSAEGSAREPISEDEFVCQFTSGVSGESRIVSRTYANITDEILNFVATIGLTSEDTILCPPPLFHAFGLFNGLVPSLRTGARFVLVRRFFPAEIIDLTERYQPTILVGVPFMYELLNRTHLDKPAKFSSYRLCLSAGAALSEQAARDFSEKFGKEINQLYGSTETGVISVNLNGNVKSVGRPVRGRRTKIFDEKGNELGPDLEGEIAVSSAGTTSGYLGRDDLNRTSFRRGWFFTGDIGHTDTSGYLYITGRKSSFINVGGLKVDPTEVENVIQASGFVKECAVVGVPSANLGEVVCAYVVMKRDADQKKLPAFCRERLASFKIPRQFHSVESLPRSPTGKMLKKYLVNNRLERSSES